MAQWCQSNTDCPQNELCYAETTWINATDEDGCLCNTFYGWGGDKCETLTRSTAWTGASNFATFNICLASLSLLFISAARLRMRNKLFSFNAHTVTIMLSSLSAVFTALWALVVCLSAATVRGPPVIEIEFGDQYKGRFNALSTVFAPLGIGFGGIALMHISLMWIEIADASGRLSSNMHNKLNRTVKLIYGWEACAVVCGLFATVFEKLRGRSVMGFALAPVVVFVILTYMWGARQLTAIISKSVELEESNVASAVSSPARTATSDKEAATQEEVGDVDTDPEAHAGLPASRSRQSRMFQALRDVRTPVTRAAIYLRSRSASRLSEAERKPLPRSMFHRVMRKVRNTAIAASAVLFLFLVTNLGISIVDVSYEAGWKEVLRPGASFVAYKAFHHLNIMSVALANFIIAMYTYVDP